jgi:hypothetical protein
MAILGALFAVLELLLVLSASLVFVSVFETSLFRSIRASEISKQFFKKLESQKYSINESILN